MPVRLFRRRPPDPVRTLPPPDPNDVRRLEIRARKLMENRALGAYDSVFRGHGVEFAEVRVRPQLLLEFFTLDHLPGLRQQHRQHPKRQLLHADP